MHILVPDAQSFHGGVETVTTRVIQAWTTTAQATVTWVLPPHRLETFSAEFGDNPNLEFESFQWRRNHPRAWLLSFLRRIKSNFYSKWKTKCNLAKLRKIIKESSCTHCFYFWTIGEPHPHLSIPTYCFIHDLAWKVVPESYLGQDPKSLDDSVHVWVSESRGVFTNSGRTRSEVLSLLPTMSNKVHAVLLAASKQQITTSAPPEEELPVDDSLPFFLYPSAANPQKNHLVLFQAVSNLLERGLRFRLILTGGHTGRLLGEVPMDRHAPEQARLFFQRRKGILSDMIIATDNVSESTLVGLYQKCLAVLMPSQYEGFGLAVAEAFAHGKPVIASDLSVFREQIDCYEANGFVETFPAMDHQALADLMESRLRKGDLSAERSRELSNKTAQWTWDDVAKSYVRFMKESDVQKTVA